MSVGKRSAISVPLTVRVLIAAAAAGVLTLTVYAMTSGGMAPNHGKPVMMLAVLAIPLIAGAKAAWSLQASLAFTFCVYFLVVFSVVAYWCRER